MNETIKNKIQEMITTNKVFLFMKGTPEEPRCGFSAQVAQIFQSLKVEFGSFNVLEDRDVWDGIKEFTDWPTIPQLYIDGKFIGGCDIVVELALKKELQKLLGINS